MSTDMTTDTTVKTRHDRPTILHYVSNFAIELGWEDRALCGVWINPVRATSPTNHRGRPAVVCDACRSALPDAVGH